jgi:hypothetical protein
MHHDNMKLEASSRNQFRQTKNEDTYHFFHQILADEKLGYWLADEGGLHLYNETTAFNLFKIDEKSITNKKKQIDFSQISISCDTLHHAIKPGYQVKIEGEQYYVHSVTHHFDKTYQPYFNEITLKLALQNNSKDRRQDPQIMVGSIESQADRPLLDEYGQYQYRLYHEESDNKPSSLSPWTQRIQFASNIGKCGLNFPLRKNSDALIGYVNGLANQPMIIGSVLTQPLNGFITKATRSKTILKTIGGETLSFDSLPDRKEVFFGRESTGLSFLTNKNNCCVRFNSPGKLNISSKKNTLIKSQQFQMQIMKGLSFCAKNELSHNIHKGNVSIDAKKNVSWCSAKHLVRADSYMVFAAENMTVKGREIQIETKNKGIRFHSKQKKLSITANELRLRAHSNIEIGTQEACIQLNPQGITIKGKVISSPFMLIGAIDQSGLSQRAVSMRGLYGLPEHPIPRYRDSFPISVTFLSWLKKSYQADEVIGLRFMLEKFNQTLSGQVIIYQCYHDDFNKIENIPLNHAKEGEHYIQIDAISFTVDTKKQSEQVLYWKARNIKHNKQKNFSYFRFRVAINGLTYPACSPPLQLFKSIEVKHIGLFKAHSVVVKQPIYKSLVKPEVLREKKLENDVAQFDKILMGEEVQIYFFDSRHLPIETISSDRQKTLPFHTTRIPFETKKQIVEIETLPPPVIINLRDKKDCHTREQLTEDELQYFKRNGNNITVFIHGFNVPYGAFEKYKNSPFFKTVKGAAKKKTMHTWLTHMEDNFNHATGFNNNYKYFSRALFIAWPGDPPNPIDYYQSVIRSKTLAPIITRLIKQIKVFSPKMKVNIIAHSLGNSILLSALFHLAQLQESFFLEHCVFWQAALPSDALSPQGMGASDKLFNESYLKSLSESDRCQVPLAHKVVKRITVFYSRNDNIIGRILEKNEQPEPKREADIYNRKPSYELLAGVFFTYLGLESLYGIANAFGFPASQLLNENHIDIAWTRWRAMHPDYKRDSYGIELSDSLDKQVLSYQHNKLLALFCHNMSKHIRQHQSHIESIIRMVNHTWVRYELKWIYYVLKHIDVLAIILLEEDKGYSPDRLLVYILTKLRSPLLKKEIDYIFTHFIAPKMPLIKKMVAFINAACFRKSDREVKGMGWGGVDNETQHALAGKLNQVDTTRWSYHHTDMLNPSDEMMEKVYKTTLFDPVRGIKFGGNK